VRIEVADSGIGIPKRARQRLFQAFSQSDVSMSRRFGGTGLGLAISSQLVTLMKGRLGFDSEPGAGSTFWFEAPFTLANTGHVAVTRRDEIAGARVLVVDDNAMCRRLLHEYVVSWGMRNGTVGTGAAAMDRLRETASAGDPYDIAIVDMGMSEMDGLETARRIKNDPTIAATKIILLAPMRQVSVAAEARHAGVDACLAKPTRQSVLFDCIAGLMKAGVYEAPTMQTKPAPIADGAASKGRVLVAEDNIVNQKVASSVLEALGYRCDVVSNGREAVDAAFRVPYDAILMDCRMPEMDGFAATAEIRRREGATRHIPIIALTADVVDDVRRNCIQAGMDAYVAKPLRRDQLAAALERWIVKAPADEPKQVGSVADENAVLDEQTFGAIRELSERAGEDVGGSIVQLFLRDAEAQVVKLRQLLAQMDAPAIAGCAHALRGSAGNIGARRVMRVSGEIDKLAQQDRLGQIEPLITELESEFALAKRALTAA